MIFPKKMIQRDNVGIIMAISMGWKSDQCTKMDAIPLLVGNTEPEGGRGDSGYYLPGI